MDLLDKKEIIHRIDNLKTMMNSTSFGNVSLGYAILLEEEWFKKILIKFKNEQCAWGYSFIELLNKMNPTDENAKFWENLNELATKTLKGLFWDFIKKHI